MEERSEFVPKILSDEQVMADGIVTHLTDTIKVAEELNHTDYDIYTKLTDKEGVVLAFAAQNIESVERTDEPGNFIMRFKEELADNKGKVLLVTGATLLACAGLIYQRKKR